MATTLGVRLIWTLFMIFVYGSEGLKLTMDRTSTTHYCGRLQCETSANTLITNNIFAITGLTVHDVTQSNNRVKLASLSIYGSDILPEEHNARYANLTGRISKDHAELTIFLRTYFDCLYGSFDCELDFVNRSGYAGVVTQIIPPGVTENNITILQMFDQLTSRISHVEDKLDSLDRKLDNLIQLLSLERTCEPGMSSENPREKFLLWGSIPALCDTETDGGRWVVIQRRATGDVDFYRNWADYKNGFGTPDTDLWIGNDVIHNLTSQGYSELRIDMASKSLSFYIQYTDFSVAEESLKYKMQIGVPSGNASGDSLRYNDGCNFSTFDSDNDNFVNNCAADYRGGWWNNKCVNCKLNGPWGSTNGMYWYHEKLGIGDFLTFTEMKVRKPVTS